MYLIINGSAEENMKRICPNPSTWNEIFKKLTMHSKANQCKPPEPPKPLILAGWAYSNDIEKMHRWENTMQWANNNDCIELISSIPEDQFYCVEEPTSYTVGPMGGPMYRSWDYETKECPTSVALEQYFMTLFTKWSEIVGADIANITHPMKFTGAKARRLLVYAKENCLPPWGEWTYLSNEKLKRRTFTKMRAAINKAISPHEIDHVDFTHERSAEPNA